MSAPSGGASGEAKDSIHEPFTLAERLQQLTDIDNVCASFFSGSFPWLLALLLAALLTMYVSNRILPTFYP